MLQRLKSKLKDQRGLTLIELLAVIVILGIISAIAIPSVSGIIDNTKKDAHIANAQEMVNTAKMVVSQNATLQTGTQYLTLGYLVDQKYLETIKDPDGGTYSDGGTALVSGATAPTTGSYVKVNAGIVQEVKLVNASRGVQSSTKSSLPIGNISRTDVIAN